MRNSLITIALSLPLLAAASQPASAGRAAQPDSSAVADRISRHAALGEELLSTAWRNPAILQFKRNYSFSEVRLSFNHDKQSQPVDVRRGNGHSTWAFDADSYMKYKSSTLWGHALYRNSRTFHVTWNETSDLDMVYPYVQADSIGGKFNNETYGFMGGYADFNGRLAWGGSISYQAGLNYRNVDPRPRNVTANLAASAGLALALPCRYLVGASVNFQKYKQTNDIAFYSELGHDKVYHLTGFANDYARFAGTGQATYYNGYLYGAELNFHHIANRGFSAAVAANRFSFDNILTEFNKLPLCHVAHTSLEAEAAWQSADWGVAAQVNASRRVGTENVFGDPAGNVYMQIGSLDQFHENRVCITAKGVWQHSWQRFYIGVQPSLAYSHLNVIYASPASLEQINTLTSGALVRGAFRPNSATRLQLTVNAGRQSPLSDKWLVASSNKELSSLLAAVYATHQVLSGGCTAVTTSVHASRAISSRYAVQAGISWRHTAYDRAGITANQLTAQLSLIF